MRTIPLIGLKSSNVLWGTRFRRNDLKPLAGPFRLQRMTSRLIKIIAAHTLDGKIPCKP